MAIIDLPFATKIVANNTDSGETVLRVQLNCDKDAEEWLRAYQASTSTHWCVRNTYPRLTKLDYRKDFVCHHSAFNKVGYA